jgi:hypothetical protein
VIAAPRASAADIPRSRNLVCRDANASTRALNVLCTPIHAIFLAQENLRIEMKVHRCVRTHRARNIVSDSYSAFAARVSSF